MWVGEGPRGRGLSRAEQDGDHRGQGPFLSRWGQAGGGITGLVQGAALGRGLVRGAPGSSPASSVPTSQGIWFGLGANPNEQVKPNSA